MIVVNKSFVAAATLLNEKSFCIVLTAEPGVLEKGREMCPHNMSHQENNCIKFHSRSRLKSLNETKSQVGTFLKKLLISLAQSR